MHPYRAGSEEIKNLFISCGIIPESCIYREKTVVKLSFTYDSKLIPILKQQGALWSKSLNGWYLPKSKAVLEKTARELALFKGIDIERTEMKELVRKLELKSYSKNTLKNYYCLVGAVPELPRASAGGSDNQVPGFSHA